MAKKIHNGLNKKEQKVLAQFIRVGKPAPRTLKGLAEACWGYLPPARANSWVRNSLRKPCILGLLEPAARGAYQITEVGREMVRVINSQKVEAAPKAHEVEAPAPVVVVPETLPATVTEVPANVPATVVEVKTEPVIEAVLVHSNLEVALGLAPAVEVVSKLDKLAEKAKAAVAATPSAPWAD